MLRRVVLSMSFVVLASGHAISAESPVTAENLSSLLEKCVQMRAPQDEISAENREIRTRLVNQWISTNDFKTYQEAERQALELEVPIADVPIGASFSNDAAKKAEWRQVHKSTYTKEELAAEMQRFQAKISSINNIDPQYCMDMIVRLSGSESEADETPLSCEITQGYSEQPAVLVRWAPRDQFEQTFRLSSVTENAVHAETGMPTLGVMELKEVTERAIPLRVIDMTKPVYVVISAGSRFSFGCRRSGVPAFSMGVEVNAELISRSLRTKEVVYRRRSGAYAARPYSLNEQISDVIHGKLLAAVTHTQPRTPIFAEDETPTLQPIVRKLTFTCEIPRGVSNRASRLRSVTYSGKSVVTRGEMFACARRHKNEVTAEISLPYIKTSRAAYDASVQQEWDNRNFSLIEYGGQLEQFFRDLPEADERQVSFTISISRAGDDPKKSLLVLRHDTPNLRAEGFRVILGEGGVPAAVVLEEPQS